MRKAYAQLMEEVIAILPECTITRGEGDELIIHTNLVEEGSEVKSLRPYDGI